MMPRFAIPQERLQKEHLRDLMEEQEALCVFDAAAPVPAHSMSGERVVLIIHFYYMDIFERYLPYLASVPEEVDLCLTTNDETRAATIRAKAGSILARHMRGGVRVCPPRGRELSALFLGCRDLFESYDIIGFLHDKKSIRDDDPEGRAGEGFSHLLWESMLASTSYIRQVLRTFDDEPQVGLLVPFPPMNGPYLAVSENFWTCCFLQARDFLDCIGVHVPLDAAVPPVALGSAFWARTEIFQKLLAYPMRLEDFPAEPVPIDGTFSHVLERIFPYLAQDVGQMTCYLAPLDDMRHAYLQSRRQYYPLKRRCEQAEKDRDMYHQAADERLAILRGYEATIHERDATIQSRDAAIHERDAMIRSREATIHAYDAAIHTLEEAAQKREERLQSLLTSRSWRITAPLRTLGGWWRHLCGKRGAE